MCRRPFAMKLLLQLCLWLAVVVMNFCEVSLSAKGEHLEIGKGENFVGEWKDTATRRITDRASNETHDYTTYGDNSAHNYNTGARYYTRYTDSSSTRSQFGFTYVQVGDYYYSPYGYVMYRSPRDFKPVFVGRKLVYFPPMFQYFYMTSPRYWNGQRPRHVCRNDEAFWPLENQTNLFVDSRLPASDFTSFDVYLNVSADSEYQSAEPPNLAKENRDKWYAMNSLLLSRMGRDYYLQFLGSSHPMPEVQGASRSSASSAVPLAEVVTYNYFACPDGKDPDETECCGKPTNQFCCVSSWTFTKSITNKPYSKGVPLRLVLAVLLPIVVAAVIVATLLLRYQRQRRERLALVQQAEASASAVEPKVKAKVKANGKPDEIESSHQYQPVLHTDQTGVRLP